MKSSLHSSQHKVLIQWLKQQRNDRDITIRNLAARLQDNFQKISKIETGERNLSVVEYVRLCEALEIDALEGIRLLQRAKKPDK